MEKRYQKRLDKSTDKNRAKREADLKALQVYDSVISDINREAMARYKSHTDEMIQKYGKKSVKELKTETIKGEEYVKRVLAGAEYSFQKVYDKNPDGSKTVRFVPVKTNYYMY